jgi:hypothetical protein
MFLILTNSIAQSYRTNYNLDNRSANNNTNAITQTVAPSFPILSGKYLGQKEPGVVSELFAPGIVSVKGGVHGNIVFTPDFCEAAWNPNYLVDGKSLIYIMKNRSGKWEEPTEFFLKEVFNYSEPFYSYDGNKLYYLSGAEDASGNAENEKIYYVKRLKTGWSEPEILSSDLPAFHWQFSLDKENNLYFGGGSPDKKGEIFISVYRNGKYSTPERLPSTINSNSSEFSPFISPDNMYLVFSRLIEKEKAPPLMHLFVSFRNSSGEWSESQNLTEKIGLPVQTTYVMMSAARISPDGKYLFFSYFTGKDHMTYWVSAKIIEELMLKE